MKVRLGSMLLLSFLLAIGTSEAAACTEVIEPLRKTFRRADAVFMAEVVGIQGRSNVDYEKSNVDGDITFRIQKSWKGTYRDQVILPGSVASSCGCSPFNQFVIGGVYLVFVDKEGNANFCDTWKTGSEYTTRMAKRLGNAGFRTWARIYPF